MEFLLEFTQI